MPYYFVVSLGSCIPIGVEFWPGVLNYKIDRPTLAADPLERDGRRRHHPPRRECQLGERGVAEIPEQLGSLDVSVDLGEDPVPQDRLLPLGSDANAANLLEMFRIPGDVRALDVF